MNTTFVDPGRMRRELKLQAMTPVADGFGGHGETWPEVATVFAAVEPLSPYSLRAADQALEGVTHRVAFRWRAGVAAGMRLAGGGRVFAVRTVHDPDGSGRYLICMVREELP